MRRDLIGPAEESNCTLVIAAEEIGAFSYLETERLQLSIAPMPAEYP